MKTNSSMTATFVLFAVVQMFFSCNNAAGKNDDPDMEGSGTEQASATEETSIRKQMYAGAISNGMKGDSIFFAISADGKKLEDLTFKGYWRCSGRLEQTTVGPDGSFEVKNGVVKGSIVEPPDGGSTAWRFELDANIGAGKATGSFRMNINNLGCDTYKLNFTAIAK
jgi:hypothetical protein